MHDHRVVSPLSPKKNRCQRFRVVDLARGEILEGIQSETWMDLADRLKELGIERGIQIEIEKQIWIEIEEKIRSEIEKRILRGREISGSEAKLGQSLDSRAERAVPNHPRSKMKKSL
jgi:Fe2+ transport system protein FeoA